jgi:plastocyanin
MKKVYLSSLLLLVMVLTACGSQAPAPGASTTSVPVVSGSEAKVEISGFAFNPATVTIKVGETITWTNLDTAAHTIAASDNSWSSGNVAKGASFSHTFETAGSFDYICGIHPSMKGTVIVQP